MTTLRTIGEIREIANQTLEDAGLTGNFPVPVDKIIENKGFEFRGVNKKYAPDNFCGMVDHEKKLVVINSSHSTGRKRFTAAHELGHIVLHPNESTVDFRIEYSFSNSSPKEVEANRFAAEILMPYEEFLNIYDKYSGDLRYIADYFDVSVGAATVRSEILGLI